MLRIRLSRTGRKNLNLFRIVLAEHKAPIKGRFIEILGHYNPHLETESLKINEKRLKYWLSVGAQPTDTVTNLLVDAKILPAKEKIKKTTKKKKKEKEEKAEKPEQIESPGGVPQTEGSAMEIAEESGKESEKETPETESETQEKSAPDQGKTEKKDSTPKTNSEKSKQEPKKA